MREKKKVFLFVFSLVLLSACSSQNYRKDTARLESSISDLRNYQAEHTAQISTLQSQIHKLSGKLEELEYMLKRRGQMAYGQLEASVQSPYGQEGGGSTDTPVQVAGDGASQVKAVPPAIVPIAALDDDEIFARSLPPNASRTFLQALSKIREGKFQESLSFLQQMVQQGERSEWTPNALFWLGVTYDGLGEDKNALRSYNDLATQFPRHKRVPLAFYRQAQVLQRLGDKKSATLWLRKLASEYPNTSEGARAKEDLKKF